MAGGGLLVGAGLLAGRRSLGALRLPALAVALAAVLAAAVSVAPALSSAGAYGRYESLPVRLAYLGLFCGSAWLGERERVVPAFLAGCTVAALETLHQAATGALTRPDGNLGQPNLLGALLAMAIPLAVDRARASRGPEPPALAWWAWLALAALFGLALAASTSRSGWLGALVGLAVTALFLSPASRRRLVVAGAGAALALGLALLLLTPLRTLNQDTGEARLGVWRDALAAAAGRPLLGWGEDTTALVLGRFQTADWEPGHNFDRAHSMPLDLAITQGAAGLVACTWLFAAWWLGVWRRPRTDGAGGRAPPGDPVAGVAGAAAAYLAWSLLNFDWAPATAAVWLLAGAAWPGAPAVAALKLWRPAAAAACAAGGLALAVPPVLADLALYAGDPARAAALAPLQPRYHAAQGDLQGLRLAAALGDPDPATYVRLGDAELAAGDRAAARAAYRRALDIYPYDREVQRRLAAAGQQLPASVLFQKFGDRLWQVAEGRRSGRRGEGRGGARRSASEDA